MRTVQEQCSLSALSSLPDGASQANKLSISHWCDRGRASSCSFAAADWKLASGSL